MKSCRCPRVLAAGRARKKKVRTSDVDQRQLKRGIKVELEHTSNRCVAQCIALDHLAEHPDYYTRHRKAKL